MSSCSIPRRPNAADKTAPSGEREDAPESLLLNAAQLVPAHAGEALQECVTDRIVAPDRRKIGRIE